MERSTGVRFNITKKEGCESSDASASTVSSAQADKRAKGGKYVPSALHAPLKSSLRGGGNTTTATGSSGSGSGNPNADYSGASGTSAAANRRSPVVRRSGGRSLSLSESPHSAAAPFPVVGSRNNGGGGGVGTGARQPSASPPPYNDIDDDSAKCDNDISDDLNGSGSAYRARAGRSINANANASASYSGGGGFSLSGLSSSGVSTRVVTGFRGVAVPEYKGHMPRVGHTAVMYERDVYVFGGFNAKGQHPSHLFRHEKRSLQWEEVRGTGVVPTGRANHSAILVGTKMYVYGGHRNLDVLDDLYCFHMDTLRWDKIGYERTQGPGPCFLHAAVHVPTTKTMLILGGFHQREHNAYLGHAFDLQNKVWSGIPGPAETNPQHLQLVTAAFHAPRDAVVVLGIVDDEDAVSRSEDPADMPQPSVHLLNIHTFSWTKVMTASSPESPVPFRLDAAWEHFVRMFVRMGGYHDEAQGCWYFPVNLASLGSALLYYNHGSEGGRSHVGNHNSDASSLSAVSARKVASASAYGFLVLRLDSLTWSALATTFPKKLLAELAAKNRERASELVIADAASRAVAGGMSSSPPLQRHLSPSTSAEGAHRLSQVSSSLTGDITPASSMITGNGAANGKRASRVLRAGSRSSSAGVSSLRAATEDAAARCRRLLLYTVEGAPQFQRKYAYAAYREAGLTRSRTVKPMKYLIMHGGLSPGEDYALLMLTPVMSRVDAFATRRAGSVGEDLDSDMWGTERDTAGFVNGGRTDDDTSSIAMLRRLLVDSRDAESDRGSFLNGGGGGGGGNDARSSEVPPAPSLLPTLPCVRTAANRNRFAVVFGAANAVRDPALLPYPNCPVAVLESECDVRTWSELYYQDTRRWLAGKLKDAVAEDQQVRRARKKLQRQAQSLHGAQDGIRDGIGNIDDISEEDDSAGPAGTTGGGTDGGAPSILDVTTAAVASAAAASSDEPEQRVVVKDFFEKRGLDVFNVDEMLAARAGVIAAASAGQRRIGLGDPTISDPMNDDSLISAAGLGRLLVQTKRHQEQQRLPASVFEQREGGAVGIAVGDLGSAMASVLMHNALSGLLSDPSPVAASRRARIRWRFLRALVRTGEAAFILYRASQEASKTCALRVTSTPGLLLAPELHLVGPTRTHKVPSRPVPYALPLQSKHATRYAEVTPSGMVVYHNMAHVK